uniref:Uncharacterized protein n=1 Tax=Glossina morsitans morsitans TaxID=37546 RepID=A0A1B0G8K2_GLOMM
MALKQVILSSQLDADFVSLRTLRLLYKSAPCNYIFLSCVSPSPEAFNAQAHTNPVLGDSFNIWIGWFVSSLLDFGEVFKWEKGYVNLKGQKVTCEFLLPSCSTNWFFGKSIALEGRGPSTYGMINITKKDWFRFRWVDE